MTYHNAICWAVFVVVAGIGLAWLYYATDEEYE